jgi:hypothetical protein
MSKKKLNRPTDKATLASVTKEMAQPRFCESARTEEEAANHQVTNGAQKTVKRHGRS